MVQERMCSQMSEKGGWRCEDIIKWPPEEEWLCQEARIWEKRVVLGQHQWGREWGCDPSMPLGTEGPCVRQRQGLVEATMDSHTGQSLGREIKNNSNILVLSITPQSALGQTWHLPWRVRLYPRHP